MYLSSSVTVPIVLFYIPILSISFWYRDALNCTKLSVKLQKDFREKNYYCHFPAPWWDPSQAAILILCVHFSYYISFYFSFYVQTSRYQNYPSVREAGLLCTVGNSVLDCRAKTKSNWMPIALSIYNSCPVLEYCALGYVRHTLRFLFSS